jgi:hypothetical protein
VSRDDRSETHLAAAGAGTARGADAGTSLAAQVVEAVGDAATPLYRAALRAQLNVNNQCLGLALVEFEGRGPIEPMPDGCGTCRPVVSSRCSRDA